MKGKLPNIREDFSAWYNAVLRLAGWVRDVSTPGCFVVMPPAYAVWELIQAQLDSMIKAMGVKNAYFPLLFPASLLQKEAEHVAGFAAEVALVTHSRLEMSESGVLVPSGKLEEPLVVRPTSEMIMYEVYAAMIHGESQLPVLLNQWANVVRWELRTRLFLRTLEFLWQEGHCVHASHGESLRFLLAILHDVYKKFCEEWLAIPVVAGAKPANQRFPGAADTFTVEALMGDGRALQMGTSHDLGQNFAKALGITFQGRDGKLHHPWQNSWGITTRLLGALSMVHGDEWGLCLPPRVAPCQVAFIPIGRGRRMEGEEYERAVNFCRDLARKCRGLGIRAEVDERKTFSPFEKMHEHELGGTPVHVDIGPREMDGEGAIYIPAKLRYAKGTGSEVVMVPYSGFAERMVELLEQCQADMLKFATARHISRTNVAGSYEEMVQMLREGKGFVRAFICGEPGCSHPLDRELEAVAKGEGDGTTTITVTPKAGKPYELSVKEFTLAGNELVYTDPDGREFRVQGVAEAGEVRFTSDDWIQAHTGGATGRVIPDPGHQGKCLRCGKPGAVSTLYAKAY